MKYLALVTWYCCFKGDMGGYMGLLLGASVITLIEVLDLIIYNAILRCSRRRQVSPISSYDLQLEMYQAKEAWTVS